MSSNMSSNNVIQLDNTPGFSSTFSTGARDRMTPNRKTPIKAFNGDADAMRDQIRQELTAQFQQEMAIIVMEADTLRNENSHLKQETSQLKQTLNETMDTFTRHIEEAKSMKSDHLAAIGLLEMEVGKLRNTLGSSLLQERTVSEELSKLKEAHERLIEVEKNAQQKIAQLTEDVLKAQNQYNLLKKHAEDKLKEAAQKFTQTTQDAAEKTSFLRQIQSELQNLKSRCQIAEKRLQDTEHALTEVSNRNEKLEANLREREAQLTTISATNSNNERQLITSRAREEELAAINERYKVQLTTIREEKRKLEEYNAQLTSAGGDVKKITAELDKVASENKTLKSRLFDSMESEKRLKTQVQSHSSSTTGVDDHKLKQMETELAALREAIETKEAENKELVTICDELLKECESLKQKKAASSHT